MQVWSVNKLAIEGLEDPSGENVWMVSGLGTWKMFLTVPEEADQVPRSCDTFSFFL